MGDYKHTFYEGSDNGLDPYKGDFLGMSYRTPASNISLATDARTANQLKAASDKLSTGAKAVEIQLTMPEVSESIPNQNLDEINRLRKLVGAELTVHGILVEPTGFTKQGWQETNRQQAERQMWNSLERAHRVSPDGNVVVTFHSSNGIPEPEILVKDDRTGKEKTEMVFAVDEESGQIQQIKPQVNYFEGKNEFEKAEDVLKRKNEEIWADSLQRIAFQTHQGSSIIQDALKLGTKELKENEGTKDLTVNKFYKEFTEGKAQEVIKEIEKLNPEKAQGLNEALTRISHGDLYFREAYTQLQGIFNKAYETAKINDDNETIKKLDEYRNSIKDKVEYIKNPEKVDEFAKEVINGVNILRTIDAPKTFKPLKEFAINKASDTFSNLAFRSFETFKDGTSPIISIENPPAGSGLSRAEDLRNLIEKSQEKFKKKLIEEKGFSEKKAEEEAKKLIGATWDVGHINMLRKFGYGNEDLKRQTKTIAPFVKNVHLSDNFGMEHTELPMGMGNVPTKAHMDILDKFNKQVKKVIETGQWYQHFQTAPFTETLRAFGSPVYSMTMAPYWNQTGIMGDYFSGKGMINPDVHHTIYGAGFSNLPSELGGQMPGNRSRVSGNPME